MRTEADLVAHAAGMIPWDTGYSLQGVGACSEHGLRRLCFHQRLSYQLARTVCVDPSLLGKKEDGEDCREVEVKLVEMIDLHLAWCVGLAWQAEERGRSRSRECNPLLWITKGHCDESHWVIVFFWVLDSRRWRKEKNDAIAARVEASKAQAWPQHATTLPTFWRNRKIKGLDWVCFGHLCFCLIREPNHYVRMMGSLQWSPMVSYCSKPFCFNPADQTEIFKILLSPSILVFISPVLFKHYLQNPRETFPLLASQVKLRGHPEFESLGVGFEDGAVF